MNIISLVCAIAGVQKVYMYEQREYKESTSMNRKRALTSLLSGNSRDSQGAWKDGALKGQLGVHATAAPL